MNDRNYSHGQDIPLGLSMAMAQNPQALDYFAGLSPEQRQEIIDDAHGIRTKAEMKQLVDGLAHGAAPGHPGFF